MSSRLGAVFTVLALCAVSGAQTRMLPTVSNVQAYKQMVMQDYQVARIAESFNASNLRSSIEFMTRYMNRHDWSKTYPACREALERLVDMAKMIETGEIAGYRLYRRRYLENGKKCAAVLKMPFSTDTSEEY
ncbi:MAG: hypothetical protein LBR29_05160 [Methylobacteriaceae bacterium]|jgi:hypothetical protein|nr:hypothetical protein [Methylobacteriaceae bacterium]